MSDLEIEDFLSKHNVTLNGRSLVDAVLKFSVKAIHFKPSGMLSYPDCYLFDLNLIFNNQEEDGQLQVTLTSDTKHIDCQGNVEPPVSDTGSKTLRSTVNYLVIIICVCSFVLCARAVIKAQLLKWVLIEKKKNIYLLLLTIIHLLFFSLSRKLGNE